MSNSWVLDAESSIFTKIKTRASSTLDERFPNILFTTNDILTIEPTFPTVYIHFLPSVEMNSDLEGTTINAISSTMQIEVTVNAEQALVSEERVVCGVLIDEIKRLGYQLTSSPEYLGSTEDTKRMVMRASRLIGQSDTI